MNAEQHAMLYGEAEAEQTLHSRVLHDLACTLAGVLNVYGDRMRAPTQLLTWPKTELEPVRSVLKNMTQQLATAQRFKETDEEYYKAIASSLGYYRDALRVARNLSNHCKHPHLQNYVKAALRFSERVNEPSLFAAAVDGNPEDLRQAVLSACKQTRKRFGDQLRDHAVSFDPPVIAEQYTYQPKEGALS